MRLLLTIYCMLFSTALLPAQLVLNQDRNAEELVKEVLLGGRVSVSNVKIKGKRHSYASFEDKSDRPILGDGLLFSTGRVEEAIGPNDRPNSGLNQGGKGNYELSLIALFPTYDATGIEFDFVPQYEWIYFNYVFASEEYTEYVNSRYNDVFAFYLSKPGKAGRRNLAKTPDGNPITINTINHGKNSEFYIDNNLFNRVGKPLAKRPETVDSLWLQTFAFDGMTKPLQIRAKVTPGETYHISIDIADVSDGAFDSAVFLEGKSFTSLPDNLEQREAILAQEAGQFRRTFAPGVLGAEAPRLLTEEERTGVGEDKSGPDGTEVVDGGESEKDVLETGKPIGKENTKTSIADFDWKLLVTFDLDSYALDGNAEQQLESGLMYIRNYPEAGLRVRGHTCNRGNKAYNQRLSLRRAKAVADYLVAAGIDRKQIVTEAWDYQLPVVENSDEGNRSQNRRVEVSLIPIK